MDKQKRPIEFKENHCWQYDIRKKNYQSDLKEINLSEIEINNLSIDDFTFEYVDKNNKPKCAEIKKFIEKHEWLGKMPIFVTHRFVTRLKKNNALAGVLIFATPNSFSYLLGKENKDKEKLISRGACISWSPKNLASWLIMKSINFMVKYTEFRIFTAYSDPEAKELGTIYQSCNFYYLGNSFGGDCQYFDLDNSNRGWFGSSGFSDRSQIIRYAKKLKIEWNKSWYKYVGSKKNYRKINWIEIPEDITKELKDEQRKHKNLCLKRKSPSKHKYAYILGKNKKETKELKNLFSGKICDYPKERGK
tara:strand:+ start:63 stop:977 length:915 start_codon:yes stop_codon:yes gene_type:complete